MLESFRVAFGAVAPFLILLGIGSLIIRLRVADRPFMNRLNALNFKVAFPFMMFNSIYSANPEDAPSLKLILTGVLAVLALILLLMLVVPRLIRENPRRGVIIQAAFRSNFVIYGLPLTLSVFGAEKSSVVGMMVMIIVSLFNVASVVVLEIFRGEKVHPGRLMLGLLKNPLLQGCAVGLVFYLFQWKLPDWVRSPVSSLSSMATTLALLTLGASLRFEGLRANRRIISWFLLFRLVLLPLVMMVFAWAIGLRGIELFLILMIFGTPSATASYPMAQNMGGDGELAGQLVFTSTVFSLLTIFCFIFALSRLGLL